MEKKEIIQIKTCELYDLLSVKCVDILSAHQMLGRVFNVIWYRHQIQIAETPEGESIARWNLEDAREDLDTTLHRLNLCDLDRKLVRYVADNVEYEKK